MKRKHKRTREEYLVQRAWHSYMKFQKKNITDIFKQGQYIESKKEFREIYLNSGRNLALIKDKALYATDKKTFNQLSLVFKEKTGKTLDKSMRALNTNEIAEMIQGEIDKMRNNMKEAGYSSKEIALAVSQYFFGSD